MGKTNTFSLREDEGLAEEVRKYTCLYEIANKGYKERDRIKSAWKVIEFALGYEGGKNNDFKLNDFKHSKHTQETAVKGVCRCLAVFNLRKNP